MPCEVPTPLRLRWSQRSVVSKAACGVWVPTEARNSCRPCLGAGLMWMLVSGCLDTDFLCATCMRLPWAFKGG